METLKDFLRKDRFAAHSGIELLEVSNGYSEARMLITSEHLNSGGVCQGGAIFTLADFAFAAVANSYKKLTLSICSTINFFHSVSSGYLYAEGREVINHQKIPFIEVNIVDEEGRLIAQFTGTGYRKDLVLPID